MNDIHSTLMELGHLLILVKCKMVKLRDDYNLCVTNGRLRLRPWRRTKDSLPYAVYWILFNRRLLERNSRERKKPRYPFRRLKIRNRRDLDDAIYHGMVSKHRQTVYRFNDRAGALNTAHASISRALEGVRKLLLRFRSEHAPDLFKGTPERALSLHASFKEAMVEIQTDLQKLEFEMRVYTHLPLRLVYEQDLHHPYGRLRWQWVRDGRPEGPLTDRRKRELKLAPEIQGEFTPFELRRRAGMRRLNRLSKIARRLKVRLLHALTKTRTHLEAEGILFSHEFTPLKETA